MYAVWQVSGGAQRFFARLMLWLVGGSVWFRRKMARALEVVEMSQLFRYCGCDARHAGRIVPYGALALTVACCYVVRRLLTPLSPL